MHRLAIAPLVHGERRHLASELPINGVADPLLESISDEDVVTGSTVIGEAFVFVAGELRALQDSL